MTGVSPNLGRSRLCLQDAAATRGREAGVSPCGGRPRRPVPDDFAATWPTLGWDEAREVYRCDPRTLARWIDETGRDSLVLARKRYRDAQREIRYRAQRKQYRMPVEPMSAISTD